jgi:hypothetical protein
MTKFNGPKLDLIILAGHMQMHNWDMIEKFRKRHIILDNIGVILAIGMMVYVTLR